MVSYELVTTQMVLYPEVMFRPRGEVDDWARRVARYLEGNLKAVAPMRSGELVDSIGTSVDNYAPTALSIDVTFAAHGIYSIYGTSAQAIDGTIYLHNPGGMTKRGTGQVQAYGNYSFRSTVPFYKFNWNKKGVRNYIDGQAANDWLTAGFRRTAARYTSLAGYETPLDF